MVATRVDYELAVPWGVVAKPRTLPEGLGRVFLFGGQEQARWGYLMHVMREVVVGARPPPHEG